MITMQGLFAILPYVLAVQGIRIVLSNDDGWAERYVRDFFDELKARDHEVALSAPAEDKSGSASSRQEPPPFRDDPCHYDSCRARSGPFGSNHSRPELNWVNTYPASAMNYGINMFGPMMWDGLGPELAVAGVNVGSNLALQVPFSGTVGAARFAAQEGIPALAFSGDDKEHGAWYEPSKTSLIYAELAAYITQHIINSGKPYLPEGVLLNINFSDVDECWDIKDWKFILSRINPGMAWTDDDVEWCGKERLPWESKVAKEKCVVSISPVDAWCGWKTTHNDVQKQALVLDKLEPLLTCLD